MSSTLNTMHVTIGKCRLKFPRRTVMSPGNNPPPPSFGPSHHTNAPTTAIASPAITMNRPNVCMDPHCHTPNRLSG